MRIAREITNKNNQNPLVFGSCPDIHRVLIPPSANSLSGTIPSEMALLFWVSSFFCPSLTASSQSITRYYSSTLDKALLIDSIFQFKNWKKPSNALE